MDEKREIKNYLIEARQKNISNGQSVRLVTIPLLPSSKGGEEKFCITQENAKREIVFVVGRQVLPRFEAMMRREAIE